MGDQADLRDRALAHYLWPPQWVGAPPGWLEGGGTPNLADLADLIVEADLPEGVKVRAFRDGMIAFKLEADARAYEDDFSAWQRTLVRLMNAQLACLQASVPYPGLMWSSVATIWSSLQVDFATGRFSAASTGQHGYTAMELYDARLQITDPFDWRLRRGPFITLEASWVSNSFNLLSDLLRRPHDPKKLDLRLRPALFRAELLQRAKVAVLDQDTIGALTNSWTACEGMLGDLLRRALDDAADRDVGTDADENPVKFMTLDRLRFFASGLWTIRHTLEFLSLTDRLSFHLYRDARDCSKARNNYLHYEEIPADEIARTAVRLAGDLFELVEEVPLYVLGQSPDRPTGA